MELSRSTAEDPTSWEVTVFKKVVANIMSFEKKLDKHHYTDNFLREGFLPPSTYLKFKQLCVTVLLDPATKR